MHNRSGTLKHNITIKINNVEIKEKEHTKYFGVLIGNKVSRINKATAICI